VTSILDIKQKSHLFMTSILDINIEKVKYLWTVFLFHCRYSETFIFSAYIYMDA